jgi:hypothetical protein
MIKSRRIRWEVDVTRMEEKRNGYRISVGKPEVKRSIGRPRPRWKDNIKKGLRELGWGAMDWIDRAQDRDQWLSVEDTVMNLQLP